MPDRKQKTVLVAPAIRPILANTRCIPALAIDIYRRFLWCELIGAAKPQFEFTGVSSGVAKIRSVWTDVIGKVYNSRVLGMGWKLYLKPSVLMFFFTGSWEMIRHDI